MRAPTSYAIDVSAIDAIAGPARGGACSSGWGRANEVRMAAFLDALARGPLVVDGAMGTQLYERGVLFSACFEELCLSKPDLVRRVHEDYVRAGAQILETNTFGANAMRLEKHGLSNRVRELNEAA